MTYGTVFNAEIQGNSVKFCEVVGFYENGTIRFGTLANDTELETVIKEDGKSNVINQLWAAGSTVWLNHKEQVFDPHDEEPGVIHIE